MKEKEVFLKGSGAYNIWTHYDSEHDGFRAFRVVVEEKSGAVLLGKVIPFDYEESVERVKKAALPYAYISGEYGDGTTFPKMPYAEYESDEHLWKMLRHGGLKTCELYPENEAELKLRIAQEHSLQTRRKKPNKDKQKLVSR